MRTWLCAGNPLLVVCLCHVRSSVGGGEFVFLSSTIGPIDAGIVDVLETAFEKEAGISGCGRVGSGTGAA